MKKYERDHQSEKNDNQSSSLKNKKEKNEAIFEKPPLKQVLIKDKFFHLVTFLKLLKKSMALSSVLKIEK